VGTEIAIFFIYSGGNMKKAMIFGALIIGALAFASADAWAG
jgi:hypothetical protein